MGDSVDLSVLTSDERDEYKRIAAAGQRRKNLLMARGFGGFLAMISAFGILALAGVSLGSEDGVASTVIGEWVMPLAFLAVVVNGAVSVQAAFKAEAVAAERCQDYVAGLDYQRRVRRRERAVARGEIGLEDDYPLSRKQMQHLWYGEDKPGLTWRDRELGEALGIDSDTYLSNWPD